jgi:hypothetical protein
MLAGYAGVVLGQTEGRSRGEEARSGVVRQRLHLILTEVHTADN